MLTVFLDLVTVPWICLLKLSLGSKVRSSILGSLLVGSGVLSVKGVRVVLYSAGSCGEKCGGGFGGIE